MKNNITVKRASALGVICYGLGDLASQFIWTFVGSYLTIFYTDIVGFAPIIVSGIMLLARVWDAINDPMMGSIAENTRSRFGRFRPYIAFGSPFLAVFAVLTFINMGNGTGGVIFSTKLGNAIGSAFGVLIMAAFGYVAGSHEQTEAALKGINTTVNLIPAILLACAAVLLWILWDKSDKDFDDIRERLRNKHE